MIFFKFYTHLEIVRPSKIMEMKVKKIFEFGENV